MKTLIAIFILLSFTVSATAFTCGNGKLAVTGMNKHQILKDCGRPSSTQFVGYGSNGTVEEWVYVVKEYGRKQMHILRINQRGTVVEIEWLGEVK